jgi:type IV secretory pathway VirB2 component (pilin)
VRLGLLAFRVLLILAVVVVLGLGGALLEGRGSFRKRWRALRGRIGFVALVLAIAGGITFVIGLWRQLRP